MALRRLTGLRYLVRVCGPDIPGFEQRYGALYPILTPAIRAIWHGAKVVVAKCEGEANMIRAVDDTVRISLVPNGVDLDGFVGRLIERKGQHHLIEAVRRLKDDGIDVTLELAGTGDALASNHAQVQALGIADRVRFAGHVPRDQMPARYRVIVREGKTTGGTTELVEEEINGLTFDWADVDVLAGHLRRLAADRALVQRMGQRSRERATRFSWESAAETYLDMFRQVAELGSGRAHGT